MSARPRAVLLDAFGTLVTLEAPVPLLRARLAERLGVTVTEAQAAVALGAEVSYYRAHMHEGIDLERVAQLHARCAEVLRQALPAAAPITQAPAAVMTELLLASLRFNVFADVPGALALLRAAGLRLIVASNWDASLDSVLDRVGLLAAVDGVINSASAGFAKPDRRLLERALALAGAAPTEALHVGDSLREDVGAALAAGVRPVLLARAGRGSELEHSDGEPPPAALAVIETLAELPELLGL